MNYVDPSRLASTKAARVLVTDGRHDVQRDVVAYLSEHNLRVSFARERSGLMHSLNVREPDLIVLDLAFDGGSGLEVLRELRDRSVVPVILMADENQGEMDRVIGLELGADDCLSRPFGLRELLARIRAALRRRNLDRIRPARAREALFRFAGWTLDQRQRTLTTADGEIVILTKGEFGLLSAFVDAPGRALSREHLLQATRMHEDVFDRSIDVQILRLRRKLETDPARPRLIRTIRGVGYRFDAEVEIA